MTDERILDVRGGSASPPTIVLKCGTPLNPLSLGSSGMWRISGPGVSEIHGYLYFDGDALYAMSADDTQPLRVNRRRVSAAWTAVPLPSSIQLGEVMIIYQVDIPLDASDPTVARPIENMPEVMAALGRISGSGPVARASGGIPLAASSGTLPPVTSASGFPPVHASGGFPPAQVSGGFASAQVSGGFPPVSGPNASFGSPLGRDPQATSPDKQTFTGRFKSEWTSFSKPKRIALILFPVAMVSAYDLLTDPYSEPAPRRRTRPAASVGREAGVPHGRDAGTLGSVAVLPSATATPTASATDSASPESSNADRGSGGKTLERRAAAAMEKGAYAEAAKYYAELARQNPDNRMWTEATRIATLRAAQEH